MRVVLIDEAEANAGQSIQIFDNPNRVVIGMVGSGLGVDLQGILNAFNELKQSNQELTNRVVLLEEKMDGFDGEKALVKVNQLVEVDASISDMTAFMGYGSWELFGRGRVTVCSGAITDDRGEKRTFLVSQTGGEMRHVLTESELAKHKHQTGNRAGMDVGDRNKKYFSSVINTYGNDRDTFETGGDQPHNNMQPYVVVQRWKRIA